MPQQMGRPPKGRQRTLEAIHKLADKGETDGAGGGVATPTVAEEIGVDRATVAKHVRTLVDEGKLERVNGIGPTGPRPSYFPTEDDEDGR